VARARRLHRRPAVLHGLGPHLGAQVPRGRSRPPARHRAAPARGVSGQRPAVQHRRLLRRVRGGARRRALPAAGGAGQPAPFLTMGHADRPSMTSADSRADLSRETGDTLDALPVHGFQGSPEEIERQWYEHVYRGRGDRMRQLTWRAIVMGSVLGGVLSLTNLYIRLKAGWGFRVAVTPCLLC